MKTSFVALLIAAVAASQTVTAEPLRIFLFTNEVPSGSVDEQLIARKESLRDLYEILSGAKYQKMLTLVQSRDRADVSIELLSRGEKTTSASSSSTRAANGGTSSQSQSAAVTKRFLNVRISAGKFTLELLTDGQPKSWRALAEQAAENIAAAIASSDQQIRKALAQ